MSLTSTISSWPRSNVVCRTSSASIERPAKISAYERATRAGVFRRPSRSGSSPTASRISRTAASIRGRSTGPGPTSPVPSRSSTRRTYSPAPGDGGRGGDSPGTKPGHVRLAGLGGLVLRGVLVERLAVQALPLVRAHDGRHRRHRAVLAGEPDRAQVALLHRREDLGELVLVERLVLEQRDHEVVEHLAVLGEHLPRLVVRGLDQLAHLVVDHRGDALGVVALVAHVAAEEDLARPGPELDRAHALAHAELGDHLARGGGGLLDVVGGAGGGVVEDQLLGHPAAHRVGELVEQLVARGRVLVLERHHHRVPERPPAGQDRHLGDRVGVPHRRGHQGVPALVVRGDLLLLVVHQPGALLRAGDDAVDRLVEGGVVDQLGVGARGEQRGLVEDVREVGTGEARCAAGHGLEVDVDRERLARRRGP